MIQPAMWESFLGIKAQIHLALQVLSYWVETACESQLQVMQTSSDMSIYAAFLQYWHPKRECKGTPMYWKTTCFQYIGILTREPMRKPPMFNSCWEGVVKSKSAKASGVPKDSEILYCHWYSKNLNPPGLFSYYPYLSMDATSDVQFTDRERFLEINDSFEYRDGTDRVAACSPKKILARNSQVYIPARLLLRIAERTLVAGIWCDQEHAPMGWGGKMQRQAMRHLWRRTSALALFLDWLEDALRVKILQ